MNWYPRSTRPYHCSHFTYLQWLPLLFYRLASDLWILLYSEDCLKFSDEVDSSALNSLMDLLSSDLYSFCTSATRCKSWLLNLSFLKALQKHFWLNTEPKYWLVLGIVWGMQKMQKKQQQYFVGISVAYNIIHKWYACRVRFEKAVKWVNLRDRKMICIDARDMISMYTSASLGTKQVSQAWLHWASLLLKKLA